MKFTIFSNEINSNTLSLSKKNGGLGVKDISLQIQALWRFENHRHFFPSERHSNCGYATFDELFSPFNHIRLANDIFS
uniref:Uncharacterized protein n=1 Tax=Manihot esculenta TaxID=3983 RepID=A0A2C9V6R4_MANES